MRQSRKVGNCRLQDQGRALRRNLCRPPTRDELMYAGKVEHGFESSSIKELQRRLKPLTRKTQPFSKRIPNSGICVEPTLAAEVEYRAKSANGHLRHPFFKGLQDDL